MSFPSRQGSISDFGNNAETKVMIASLKAGGIGIDLTMANKCILVEPWWNDAVQQQAFCRLFRIGQERNVEIVKIVIEDTIDVYMMQLQEKKNKNIEEAIGDQALTGRNTALELMEMFGEVEEHEGGGIVIHRRSE
jgi:SNF2 family DNA or RNA helicase